MTTIGATAILVCLVGLWFTTFFGAFSKSFTFLFSLGVIGGAITGELNYKWNMQPLYTATSLRERTGVDPAQVIMPLTDYLLDH